MIKLHYPQVWNACKPNTDDPEQPNYEMDILAGHENDVNYVQFRLVYIYFQILFITFSFCSMLFPCNTVVVQ